MINFYSQRGIAFYNKNISIFINLKTISRARSVKPHFNFVISCRFAALIVAVKNVNNLSQIQNTSIEFDLTIIILIFIITLITVLTLNYFKLKFDWHSYTQS